MNDPASALAGWLVTYLLHSTLLCGVVWLIDGLRLLRAPAAREYLWRAALIGALLTTTAQGTGLVERTPLAPLRVAPQAIAKIAVSLSSRLAPGAAAVSLPVPATSTVATATIPSPVAPPAVPAPRSAPGRPGAGLATRWPGWLTLVWLAGAGLAALRLLLLGWLARRELADRAPAEGALAGEFASLCAVHGIAAPALSVAPALAGPVSLPNGEIVVPPWTITSLAAHQRRAMLAHELAHQMRRDPLWRVLALGLEAVLWLQPFNRLARRRLANLAELEADAWAARAVDDPRALVECLAECAGRLDVNRAALFGPAMATESPLSERVDRLLKGMHMQVRGITWPIRCGVIAALVAALFLLPGCRVGDLRADDGRISTRVSLSDDGESSVTVRRAGYSLQMESSGKATFAADESDLATLEPGATFTLTETLAGVKHAYTVKADRPGALSRAYARDDRVMPMDAAATQWLAAALPRMFRDSGLDAEARVARLLARGGPALVLTEIDLAGSDHAKAIYLGRLFDTATLDTADAGFAAALVALAAEHLDSDFELRSMLETIAPRATDPALAAAYLAAVRRLDSDFERRTALTTLFDKARLDTANLQSALDTTAGLGSDFEKRTVLVALAGRVAADPVLNRRYREVARALSDFERGAALQALDDAMGF